MNRIGLLLNDGLGDDQVLETDIMRFMAIIGIVFWIIFSLVKSMPLVKEPGKSAPIVPVARTLDAGEPQPNQTKQPFQALLPDEIVQPDKTIKAESKPNNTVEQKQEKIISPEPEKTGNQKKKAAPGPARKGLGLEFESQDAIFKLMKNNRLEIFARTRATGFDLIFKAHLSANNIRFQSSVSLPGKLWEIKDGEAHAHFIHLMSKTFPSIKTFPEKQILIYFTDSGLDQLVESEFNRLLQENKNGILSVTANGQLIFKPFSQINDMAGNQNQGAKE